VSWLRCTGSSVITRRYRKEARSICPHSLWKVAFRKLDQLDSAETIDVLRIAPGNHLEKLIGDQLGKYSIRININIGFVLFG